METCCCGTKVRNTPVRIRVSPCKCEAEGRIRGPGPSTIAVMREFNLDEVPESQYNERKRIGLPVQAPCEKGSIDGGNFVEHWDDPPLVRAPDSDRD